MIDKTIYKYLLSTDGINQLERSPLSLDPASVKIDGRTKQDILRFLLALSAQIRFYDLNNLPQGDWRPFLKVLSDGNDVLSTSELDLLFQDEKNSPPHIALLMAFLEVYSHVQEDINQLSIKRLNFYYEEVLKVVRRAAIADQVHVIFELAKNALPIQLKKGELLDAGKTSEGTPLLYALDSEYIISEAKIAMIMSSITDQDVSGRRIIYRADDATKVVENDSGWRPFGAPQLKTAEESQSMEAAPVGCAIASPNFFLAEGRRIVTVKLHLRSNDRVPVSGYHLGNVLDIKMSGESGWIQPTNIGQAILIPNDVSDSDFHPEPVKEPPYFSTLTIKVEFNEASPAIVAYNEDIHQKRLKTSWPVWSMNVKPTSFFLDTLSQFTVSEVEIAVEVQGLKSLILQNDQAVQSIDAPVVPFGQAPSIGSNFYIGNTEAFSKSITSLSVNLQWKDVPDNMATHYAEYENLNINNSVFQGDLYLLAGRTWHKLTAAKQTLFNSGGNSLVKTISIGTAIVTEKTAYSNYQRQPGLSLGNAFSLSTQQGFIKLVLTNPTKQDVGNVPTYAPFEAFGHKSFPTVYTQHAIQIAQEIPGVILPQPPYTPTLSSVSIDYIAGDKFKPETPNLVDQFFLLDVFGAVESDEVNVVPLVLQPSYKGALYLGFEKAEASQLLSLFFHIDEGSTPGTELLEASDITWSFLAGSRWQEISKADILEDKTGGFQGPGLVRLLLGPDASREHTLMPEGLHWIRASVAANVEGAANILNIHTQAGRATLQVPEDGFTTDFDAHLASPLAVDTIKALKNKIPAIKKVSQPYPSFGGKPSESDAGYYQRVHERLRHRNRAVSTWDYERLILETFPVIYKVKSLPHTDENNQLIPGDVKLVVVPDWRKRPTGNPLQPKVNGAFLRTMEDFIQANHTSAFTKVHVSNPVYETLLVDCNISFNAGFDPGFYAAQLEEEIKRFLSPWSYDEGEDIVFGGKIHASEILAFIEGREYVDYVADFALYHRHQGHLLGGISEMQIAIDFEIGLTPEPTVGPTDTGKIIGQDFVVGVPVDMAAATRPDAILVSSNTHRIGVLSEDVCEGTQNIGIGQMVVGLDFIIVS